MVEVGWGRLALYALCFYIPLAPFAFMSAREEGNRIAVAITRTVVLYAFVFLWIAGGSFILYGIGMAFGSPAESCGIGCVEPASGHWETPNLTILILGLAFIAIAWWLGRAAENIFQRLNARAALDPKRDAELREALQQTLKKMSEPLVIKAMEPLPDVPPGEQKKKVAGERTGVAKRD